MLIVMMRYAIESRYAQFLARFLVTVALCLVPMSVSYASPAHNLIHDKFEIIIASDFGQPNAGKELTTAVAQSHSHNGLDLGQSSKRLKDHSHDDGLSTAVDCCSGFCSSALFVVLDSENQNKHLHGFYLLPSSIFRSGEMIGPHRPPES